MQVYQPLEFLLFVAAISTVVEVVLPALVAVQKGTVRIVVGTMLSLTYVRYQRSWCSISRPASFRRSAGAQSFLVCFSSPARKLLLLKPECLLA
jgi:hypothetical protein